jgi:F-type H+-transporting ATPase subunit a
MFNPPGVPVFLRPLTTAIEVFSYILRNFSLPIRLFANMLAGHILLAIIASSFIATASYVGQIELGAILFLIDTCAVFAIIALEIAVAGIQAYVFTVLTIIYLRDSLGATH